MAKFTTVSGDAVRIADLANAMLEAFEVKVREFSAEGKVEMVDLLLAGHNVHRRIVEDCLERSLGTTRQKYELIASMRETWDKAMNELLRKKANG